MPLKIPCDHVMKGKFREVLVEALFTYEPAQCMGALDIDKMGGVPRLVQDVRHYPLSEGSAEQYLYCYRRIDDHHFNESGDRVLRG